jgi:hypothetical protein
LPRARPRQRGRRLPRCRRLGSWPTHLSALRRRAKRSLAAQLIRPGIAMPCLRGRSRGTGRDRPGADGPAGGVDSAGPSTSEGRGKAEIKMRNGCVASGRVKSDGWTSYSVVLRAPRLNPPRVSTVPPLRGKFKGGGVFPPTFDQRRERRTAQRSHAVKRLGCVPFLLEGPAARRAPRRFPSSRPAAHATALGSARLVALSATSEIADVPSRAHKRGRSAATPLLGDAGASSMGRESRMEPLRPHNEPSQRFGLMAMI